MKKNERRKKKKKEEEEENFWKIMYLTSDDDDHDYIPPTRLSTRRLPILPFKYTGGTTYFEKIKDKIKDEFKMGPIK